MTAGKGLLLGRTLTGKLIWLAKYCHFACFAPSSAGKGVSYLIPWVWTWDRGSVLVLDPKGSYG